jgi:hypothetical protein
MSFESDVAVEESVESEVLELTEREIAIAQGEDPDAVALDDVVDSDVSVVDQVADELLGDAKPEEKKAEAVEPPKYSEAITGKAKSLGLSDEDVEAFGSEAALRLHVSLLERIEGLSATKAVDEVKTESAEEKVEPTQDELIDLALYEGEDLPEDEKWDDRSLAIPRALRREQEARIQLQEQVKSLLEAEQARVTRQVEDTFHSTVDTLDDGTFGRSRDASGRVVKLSDEQFANRTKLYKEVDLLASALQEKAVREGKPVELTWEEVVEKARVTAFGSPKVSKAEALKKQSASRRPVSTSASAQRQIPKDDSPESIAELPDIKALWDKFQRENGN